MERRIARKYFHVSDQGRGNDHKDDPNQKLHKAQSWKERLFFPLVAMMCFLVGRRGSYCENKSWLGLNKGKSDNQVENKARSPPTIRPTTYLKELHLVGEEGGAWTAETHLRKYGFNVDAGLVDILEESCREIENNRQTDGSMWKQHDGKGPIHGLWKPPSVVDCRVLELGPGVGVYVDSLKKDKAKKNRQVYGIEPNPMGGAFERRNGPKQLAIDILEASDTYELAKTIRNEELNGKSFDLVYSIEVCEHMPPERHEDAAKFLAGLSRRGTKLIFGAAHKGQSGTGHIGNRSKEEWEGKNQKQPVSQCWMQSQPKPMFLLHCDRDSGQRGIC